MAEPILATWGSEGPVHLGRSFTGHPLEDDCPCVKAPCGLVAEIDPDCEQHGKRSRTIRQVHKASECPFTSAPKRSDASAALDDAHDWEDVAKRVVRRVKSGARRPLDNDLRLRITGVPLDTAADDDA